ncbi:MAG: PD-(D/E)XK nuclease family protein [Cetobacterium sp.]
MEKQEYKLFFENLDLIKRKYDILHSFEDEFNIFSILRNERDEVNLHSKFIGELLKNKSFGDIFLKLFLEILEIEIEEELNKSIYLEYGASDNGRIDILLKINSKSLKKTVIIENKIDAGDQWQQLQRYVEAMKKEGYSKDEITIIYLTLAGETPSNYSLGCIQDEEVIKLSYKEHIISWIEKCIKEVAVVPSLRETLIQYKKLLEKLTGKGEKKMIDELKEMILSKEKYLSAAYLIPDILLEIKRVLQYRFWKKLEVEMEKLNLKEVKFEDEFNTKFDLDKVNKFYTTSTNKRFYGIMYEIKELEDGNKLYLRIEVDHNIYLGLRVIDKDGNSNKILDKQYLNRSLKEFGFTTNNMWLGWRHCYLDETSLETINFNKFDAKLAGILKDEDKLKKLVESIVVSIKKDLDKLKENEVI